MDSIGNILIQLAGNLNQWGVVPFTLADDRRDWESEFQPGVRREVNELDQESESVVKTGKDQWQCLSASQLSKGIYIQGFVCFENAGNHSHIKPLCGHTHQLIQFTRLQLDHYYKFHWTPNEPRGDLPI